ncbi:angiopoietin-related protein 4-like [Drosophila busckii]|uniref:angiopoietin-related protein 4-like n=1 Tax=Drosophila busckii TaxID=30019 RepID=UPI00143342A6|nr:angiopoietin-related protein 4-like [Drosophila busckii]
MDMMSTEDICNEYEAELLELRSQLEEMERECARLELENQELVKRLDEKSKDCSATEDNLEIVEEELRIFEEINESNFNELKRLHIFSFVSSNADTDLFNHCNNVTDPLLKNLGEYKAKIDELEFTMNSLQTKLETFLKESEQLLNKTHGHELSIKQQQVEYTELLRNHSLIMDQFETTVKQQELSLATLKAEKDKLIADLNVQKQMNRTEPPSCIAYGNDIQRIRVPGADAFQAPCHTTFEPIKGWTVIQRRFNGSVSFDRKWDEYKNGFGDLRGEYWLGLEKLHLMTKFQPHELYIELENHEGEIFN